MVDPRRPQAAWQRLRWAGLVAVLLLAALPRVWLVQAEFGRNADGTGTLYSIAARNYLIRDNAATLWMPVISVGDPDHPPTVYAHHPPTVPLLMAGSLAVFGDHTVAMRLPMTLFTVLSAGLLYHLLTRNSPRDPTPRLAQIAGGVVAGIGLALCPFAWRFGQMPDVVGSQLVFVCLVCAWAYLAWRERPGPWRAAGVAGSMVLATLTDWPAFFLVAVMFADLLWRRRTMAALAVAGLATLLFLGLFLWVSAAAGDFGMMWRQFANRSIKSSTDAGVAFTTADWFVHALQVTGPRGGWVLLPLGLAGIGLSLARRGGASGGAVVLVTGWAVLHHVVGRQSAFNHDWWWWPGIAALAMGSGVTIAAIPRTAWSVAAASLAGLTLVVAGVREGAYLRSTDWLLGAETHYSLTDLGTVVRRHTPPGRAAMLFQNDLQPYVPYHTQRPVLQAVWDAETFRTRLAGDRADLFYSFHQALTAPPASLVIPVAYLDRAGDLLGYVRPRFAEVRDGPFVVFLLDPPELP